MRLLSATILSTILLCAPLQAQTASRRWLPGRVLVANLSGHGPSDAGEKKSAGRGDAWWTYCFSAGGKAYTAVSRQGPAQTGLEVNSKVRFSISKNRMTVLNSRKERFVLRIIRQNNKGTCQ